ALGAALPAPSAERLSAPSGPRAS
ncbi:MAG: hypothetical protein JWR62_613, partial [Modestobacter sp.]|nr:hypothetical protein [Modestobacter sp.]